MPRRSNKIPRAYVTEEKARRAMRIAYLRENCPQLFRPGIVFTAEQRAAIASLPEGDLHPILGVLA